MDSSKGRVGPEDCRHTVIEKRSGNMVDCRMVGTEDCRTGGNSCLVNVGVGVDVEQDVCVESLRSCRQREISSHINMLNLPLKTGEIKRSHAIQICATVIDITIMFMMVVFMSIEIASLWVAVDRKP